MHARAQLARMIPTFSLNKSTNNIWCVHSVLNKTILSVGTACTHFYVFYKFYQQKAEKFIFVYSVKIFPF